MPRALAEHRQSDSGRAAYLALAPTPGAALWLARVGVNAALSDAGQVPAALGDLPLSIPALPERSLRITQWAAGSCCRPGHAPSATGGEQVVFVTLEDESGYVNVIVRSVVAERDRRALVDA